MDMQPQPPSIIIISLARRISALVLCCLFGCTSLPMTGSLPVEVRTVGLGTVNSSAPLAWSTSGTSIAMGDNGIEILDIPSGKRSRLAGDIPSALCWSASGTRLSAAFPHGETSILRTFNLQGRQLAETTVNGYITRMIWKAPDEVLAMAVTLEKFTFGGNLKAILYRWDGTATPTMTILNDTTVRPYITKWPTKTVHATATFALSPLGDEIVFTRFHDPPLISPALEIVLRHLESGAERQVASVSPASGGAAYSADGELLLYGDGISVSHWYDPWEEKEISFIASPGRTLTTSPSGRSIFVDGHLFLDGKELAAFPGTCSGTFSPNGDHLLISHDSKLFLLSGLDGTHRSPSLPDNNEQLLTLRKWRSQGLISPGEYRAAKERMLQK